MCVSRYNCGPYVRTVTLCARPIVMLNNGMSASKARNKVTLSHVCLADVGRP